MAHEYRAMSWTSSILLKVFLLTGIALFSFVNGQDGLNFRFSNAGQPTLPIRSASSNINTGAFRFHLAPSPSSSFARQPFSSSFRPVNRNGELQPTPLFQPSTSLEPRITLDETRLSTTTPASLVDDDQPTRTPTNRFRPTVAPTSDRLSRALPSLEATFNSVSTETGRGSRNNVSLASQAGQISSECFECICEASTNCNLNSRCQTSDVRHTRCGPYLISYSQWLETGLSNELTPRDSLTEDLAADERAFYECVTNRECAERLMAIYMKKNAFDCDKDGRLDCYDMAAIHQGGTTQCHSEPLLDSQYWSDFNACFGFSR